MLTVPTNNAACLGMREGDVSVCGEEMMEKRWMDRRFRRGEGIKGVVLPPFS